MKELIKKYDRSAPRYTSYPPVPFWKNPPTQNEWIEQIKTSIKLDPRVDLYLHIPYCEQLCYYCGCNRIITKDKNRGNEYADALIKEWRTYLDFIDTPFTINSLHFGGGTPTFLHPDVLSKILSEIRQNFADDFIGAIEIDPRTCTKEHLRVLRHFGISRVSLGIQDFDENVQAKINRKQSAKMVEGILEEIRSHNFRAINFDLIYGLPGQTKETILKTMSIVKELGPDTIAFYSYAHLPERIANQRLIKNSDLPNPEEKLDLYLTGHHELIKAGYIPIGMDHFAKPGSHLAGNLTRNFMGYTDKKGPLLIGLGSSSISQGPDMFVQNDKDITKYMERAIAGELPTSHGHKLNNNEIETSKEIQNLFCEGQTNYVDSSEIRELESDGLIQLNNQKLSVTPLGKNFLRNIAVAIDPLMKTTETLTFSRTI